MNLWTTESPKCKLEEQRTKILGMNHDMVGWGESEEEGEAGSDNERENAG